MIEGPREELYMADLKTALDEYHQVNREIERLMLERSKKARLVKSLIDVMKIRLGESRTRELIEKWNLIEMARPFFTVEFIHTAGVKTVVRRRKGRKEAVAPSAILQKGTPVKMLSGAYAGYTGVVASYQAMEGPKGLDVTYFLALEGPKGEKKRTSVKHGTLNKTWAVLESE